MSHASVNSCARSVTRTISELMPLRTASTRLRYRIRCSERVRTVMSRLTPSMRSGAPSAVRCTMAWPSIWRTSRLGQMIRNSMLNSLRPSSPAAMAASHRFRSSGCRAACQATLAEAYSPARIPYSSYIRGSQTRWFALTSQSQMPISADFVARTRRSRLCCKAAVSRSRSVTSRMIPVYSERPVE